jgi:hypothetical protein
MQIEQVHQSVMTGKLLGLKAISTNTLTNAYCYKQFHSAVETICKNCYSYIMLESYRKNMQACLERNSKLLSGSVLHDQQLPTIMEIYYRFQAHGELINMNHLVNLMNIAKKNPLTTFALWTKRNDLIQKYLKNNEKPKNLILIYSNPKKSKIMSKPPKHFDKTFNTVLEHEHKELQNCTGQKCKDCLACYKFNNIDTIVEKVKRY